jgi:hypothetical protein
VTKLRLLTGILYDLVCAIAPIAVVAGAQTSPSNEWTWMGASSTDTGEFAGSTGAYGIPGIPAP